MMRQTARWNVASFPPRGSSTSFRAVCAAMVLSALPKAVAAEGRAASTHSTATASGPRLDEVVRANLEPSYLAYLHGFEGLEPLFYETSIVPNFSVFPRSWHVALFLTPKIVLRMFRQESTPVKTPSYMPRLTAYFWFEEPAPWPFTMYFSASIGHHSNGQAGPFSNANGSRNHETGSFDTNEIELSAHPLLGNYPLFTWNALTIEYHPPPLEDANLRGTYGNTRIHWATTVLATRGAFVSQLSATLTGIIGRMQRPSNGAAFWARFPVLLRFTVRPPAIDVGVYAAYYQGQDYYNIWYDRFVSMLEVGISGNLSTGIDFDLESVGGDDTHER